MPCPSWVESVVAEISDGETVANALGLEQQVVRPSHRMVVVVARGPDQGNGLSLREPLGVANRSILDEFNLPLSQPGDVLTGALPRHSPLSIASSARSARRSGHLPRGDHPEDHVEDERDVDPPGVGRGRLSDPPPSWFGAVANTPWTPMLSLSSTPTPRMRKHDSSVISSCSRPQRLGAVPCRHGAPAGPSYGSGCGGPGDAGGPRPGRKP